jgi:hypothetical protein
MDFISRWTNGAVESFIGTRKRKEKSFLRLMPADYTNYTYSITKGGCIDFTNDQKSIIKKGKKRVANKIIDEESVADAKDIWQKSKPRAEVVTTIQKKTVQTGHYQSSKIIKASVILIKGKKSKSKLLNFFITKNFIILLSTVSGENETEITKTNIKYNENSLDNDDIVETIRRNSIPPQIECEYSYNAKSYIEYVVGDCKISSYEKYTLRRLVDKR